MAGQTVRGALEELGARGVMAALGLDPLPGPLTGALLPPSHKKKLYLGGGGKNRIPKHCVKYGNWSPPRAKCGNWSPSWAKLRNSSPPWAKLRNFY